jgi:hypothetical protein
MGGRQIVLVSTAGFSVLNAGIFWREAKTKRLFSQWTVNNKKNNFVVGYLKTTDEKSRIRKTDPSQNVTDPEHCVAGNL